MSNSVTLSLSEAKKLLGISGNGRPTQHAVETSYAEKMKHWSPARNCALTLKDRERAEDVIALLQEAKKICRASKASGATLPFFTITPHQTTYAAPYFHGPGSGIIGLVNRVRVFVYSCAYAFGTFRLAILKAVSMRRDFIDWCFCIFEIIRIVVVTAAKICAIPFTLPLSILRIGNDTVGRKIFAAACVIGCLFLLDRFNHHFIEPSGAKENAIINSRAVKESEHHGTAQASPYSHLLIRSWPASQVKIDGKKVEAPARKSVKLQAGKRSFYFVPADRSIKPLKVTVNLLRGRSMELRVNLESRKYNLKDRGRI